VFVSEWLAITSTTSLNLYTLWLQNEVTCIQIALDYYITCISWSHAPMSLGGRFLLWLGEPESCCMPLHLLCDLVAGCNEDARFIRKCSLHGDEHKSQPWQPIKRCCFRDHSITQILTCSCTFVLATRDNYSSAHRSFLSELGLCAWITAWFS
jgi:hypothetical protein